ncbi:MAG: VWA domain-containing protein [Dehalococcoidia bacterium]|jgi:Ca-activated chloride channel homolog|nr:VWA domain-containing protein [Dehalococcoidia bacterium]MBT7097062.1 VWA domain-containing protein [Candidatus Poribacteria bacterium]
MTFATPELLWLLPIVALLAAFRLLRPGRAASLSIADGEAAEVASRPTWRLRFRWLPTALRIAALLVAIVALARPREGLAITQLPSEGIDIVIAVDVSSSMTISSGTAPGATRLSDAQAVVSAFVESLEGDRVGLVIFQSRALALAPLTHDLEAIQQRIETLEPGLVVDGTAIGLGITEAVALLEQSPARSRVVVLLTDGHNNVGEIQPLEAARIAQALGVHVYTIGFVSGGGIAGTAVDAQTLRAVSESTDAKFYNARTQEELLQAYTDIGELERSRVGQRRFVAFREFAPWFLLGVLGLLLAELTLRVTWLRRYP